MAFKLFQLSGEVTADDRPVTRSFAAIERSVGRLGARFDRLQARAAASLNGVANGLRSAATGTRGLYAALSLAAGVAGGVGLFRKAVVGASDLAETYQKVGVVFGDSAGIVSRGADEMADRFGVVKREFLDAGASLGLIGKAAGLSEAAAATLADRLARLAIDASSFYNVPVEEALVAMRAGLVGESEPLRRFGVLLNEAAVDNEALRLGLVQSKKEITEGAKVQARSSLIIRGLADATGDLARTEGSFANKVRKIQGQLENGFAAVGEKLLPLFQALADSFSSLIADVSAGIESNSEFIARWVDRLSSAASVFNLIWKEWPRFVDIAMTVAAEKLDQFLQVLDRVGVAIGRVFDHTWGALSNKVESTVNYLKNLFMGFAKFLSTLFGTIGANLAAQINNQVVDLLGNSTVGSILEKIPGVGEAVKVAKGLNKVPVPEVRGDLSGLTDKALAAGAPAPFAGKLDFADLINKPLRDFGDVLSRKIQDLKDINAAEAIRGSLGRLRRSVASIAPGVLTPVQKLNADSRRRGLARPDFADTTREGQARAEGILARRAEADARARSRLGGPAFDGTKLGLRSDTPEARDAAGRRQDANALAAERARQERAQLAGLSGKSLRDAIESQRLKREARGTPPEEIRGGDGRAGGGLAGFLGGQAGRLGEAFAKKAGLGGQGGRMAGMLAAGLAGGVPGVVGALLGRAQPAGVPGQGGGAAAPGGAGRPMIDPAFKSEFHGLADFQRQLSAGVLSGEGKDKQLGVLEGIQSAIGGGGADSVKGLLTRIANKPAGAGFAV